MANLIAQDEVAIQPPKFELVDAASVTRAEGMVNYEEDYDDLQDAYGEADYDMQDEDDESDGNSASELEGESLMLASRSSYVRRPLP